jgi:hypothetical protein
MSSQRGNSDKHRKPAHQNKFAFVANKHDSKAMAIVELPLGGVCAHCLDVLEWRKRMNRFKPIKNIGKCQVCQQRNITQVFCVCFCLSFNLFLSPASLCHICIRATTAFAMPAPPQKGCVAAQHSSAVFNFKPNPQVCCHCGKKPMAVPTLTALEDEKKQAHAAEEELQVHAYIWCTFP